MSNGEFKGNESAKGGGFDKHPENINKLGRPKKIYTVLKAQGYSKDDMKTAFGELAFYTLNELEKLHNDEKKPIIMRITANQLLIAHEKGDWYKIKEIIEHTIGRPVQPTKLDITKDIEIDFLE